MTRNLKVLGLALVAVFAMSAVVASAASATTHELRVEKTPATLIGVQEEASVFTAGENEVSCTESSFEGSQSVETASTVRAHPKYFGECEANGLNAEVDTTGCDYVFSGETTEDGHAHVELDCGHENAIEIDVAGLCKIVIEDTHDEVPVNQTLDGVRYENITDPNTGKEAVTVEPTVTNVAYTVEGAFCVFAGLSEGTHTGGTYSGNVILTGTSGGSPIDVTME